MKIEMYQVNDKAVLHITDENISVELKFTEQQLEQLEYTLVEASHAIMRFKKNKGVVE